MIMRNLRRSYEEYDHEKIENKSKEFLKRIIGEEKFDRFQKDGKIEIEIDNKLNTDKTDNNNGKTVYELHSDGRVINKTKNQSYCIVTNRSDYPINDMIAIKYAWLTHRNDIVEKVANKTHLYSGVTDRANGRPVPVAYSDFIHDMEQRGWNRQQHNLDNTPNLGSTPWYGDYVDHMSGRDWHRELIIIDQNNTNISTTLSIDKDTTGTIVDVRCPAGMKMSIMGTRQVPRGADARVAYSLGLYITDENGEEILDDTKIRITKIKPSEAVIQLARVFYQDVKMTQDGETSYRFIQGIEINGQEHIVVHMINSPKDIPAENVTFKMEADLWARNI
jgi:hypothetical protein